MVCLGLRARGGEYKDLLNLDSDQRWLLIKAFLGIVGQDPLRLTDKHRYILSPVKETTSITKVICDLSLRDLSTLDYMTF